MRAGAALRADETADRGMTVWPTVIPARTMTSAARQCVAAMMQGLA